MTKSYKSDSHIRDNWLWMSVNQTKVAVLEDNNAVWEITYFLKMKLNKNKKSLIHKHMFIMYIP